VPQAEDRLMTVTREAVMLEDKEGNVQGFDMSTIRSVRFLMDEGINTHEDIAKGTFVIAYSLGGEVKSLKFRVVWWQSLYGDPTLPTDYALMDESSSVARTFYRFMNEDDYVAATSGRLRIAQRQVKIVPTNPWAEPIHTVNTQGH
jgi:hypothetical protein